MTDPRVDRVRARLKVLDPPALKALLSRMPGADPTAAARVHGRIEATLARPSAPPSAGVQLAKVGVVMGVVAAVVAAWLTTTTPPPPAPLDAVLEPGGTLPEIPGLTLGVGGRGQLSGTTTAPRLEWLEGQLVATVRVGGAPLVIRTREAEATVEGASSVYLHRNRLGTTVSAVSAAVSVHCAGGTPLDLQPGQRHTCWPASAAGLLARAEQLAADGASLDDRLATLDAAVALPASDAETASLGVARVEALLDHGRSADALAAARAVLDDHPPIHGAMLQELAATLALELEGCTGALPHLAALGPEHPRAAVVLDRCTP